MSRPDQPFSPRALAWAIGIAAASFALAILLAGTSDRMGGPESFGADGYSRSAVGHRGLAELLAERGLTVRHRRKPSTSSPPGEMWLMLEPALRPTVPLPDEYDPVADTLNIFWLESDPILLVPAKWRYSPDPLRPDRIELATRSQDGEALRSFEALVELTDTALEIKSTDGQLDATCSATWGAEYRVSILRPRFLDRYPDLEPLVTCDGEVLIGSHPYPEGSNEILVAADADLFSNHGLGQADHARLVLDLLERSGSTGVLFDETIHGHVDDVGVLGQLLRFPMSLLTIQGLLLAGVALWAGASRFGTPRPPPAPLGIGRQMLIGNVAELIAVIGRTADLLPIYRRQSLRAVAQHFGLGEVLDEGVVLRVREIERFRGVKQSLDEIPETPHTGRIGRGRLHGVLKTAMRLHRWRREMTDVD